MRTPQIVLTIGRDAPAIAIPGVSQIRGVLIDNPSGAWLLLRPTNDYIPPYTIGFARSFAGAVATIGVEFPPSGPAGQVTTFAGDPPVIVLDDEPVGNNAGVAGGSPFIEQFTPVLTSSTLVLIPTSTGVVGQVLIAAIANKRFRILTAMVSIGGFGAAPPSQPPYDNGVLYNIESPTGTNRVVGRVSPDYPVDSRIYPNGLDCDVGQAVTYTAIVDWQGDNSTNVTLTYQVI